VSSETEVALQSLAVVLTEYDATLVSVHGHTDDSGSGGVNQELSEQRAVAVARFLLGQGLSADRLIAVGHGSSKPMAANDSAAGREQNRRIELQIDPIVP
jgi:outer membrane protein OmpA-like peptidoglycan-associated protein